MRIIGTVMSFSPETKGVTSDGREWKKRSIVVDASYVTEQGDDVKQQFVADTFKDFTDEQLEAWYNSKQKLAFYIHFNVHEYNGAYYQDVTLSNIKPLPPTPSPRKGGGAGM